ncbi:MAG: riboflavin synthase [Geminicoccaceae bacterium]
MFTGIVTHQGEVVVVEDGRTRRLTVRSTPALGEVPIGASVCHAGICLTVVNVEGDQHVVEASGETMARTTLGDWGPGHTVNLERSLRLGDELGGHVVFGHVDTTVGLVAVEPEGECYRLRFTLPSTIASLVAVKGSVALDGVSLTIAQVSRETFEVVIVPHTWAHTTLCSLQVGAKLNAEADMLARYVARQLDFVHRSS